MVLPLNRLLCVARPGTFKDRQGHGLATLEMPPCNKLTQAHLFPQHICVLMTIINITEIAQPFFFFFLLFVQSLDSGNILTV